MVYGAMSNDKCKLSIERKGIRIVAATLASFQLFLISCGTGNTARVNTLSLPVQNNRNSQSFSGKEYYLGLIWKTGPVAKDLVEIDQFENIDRKLINQLEKDSFQKYVSRAAEILEKNDADFFVSFKKTMESGDRFAIYSKILDAQKKTQMAVSTFPEIQNAISVSKTGSGDGQCFVVVIGAVAILVTAVVLQTAVVANSVVQTSIAFTTALAVTQTVGKNSEDQSPEVINNMDSENTKPLLFNQMVNSIATKYGKAH